MSLSKPLVEFYSKLINSEAPISVITEILSENDEEKLKFISEKFDELRFTKVKDLARARIRKDHEDTLAPLYVAMENYLESVRLDDLLTSARSELQNGNFIKTQELCEELYTHNPTSLYVMVLMAKSFYLGENYEKCINWLKKAENVNPHCPEVLSNLGLVYLKKSENDLAKDYSFKACSMNPFCTDAWTNYANILEQTNDLITADMAFARVLDINPELYQVRNDYGKLLLKLNKCKEAEDQLKIALNSAEECPVILRNLADLYYLNGKFHEAISTYQKVLEIIPDDKNALHFLAMAHDNVEEFQNASNAFIKLIALDPENVTYLRQLAIMYRHQGDMVLCAETFKKCLKLKSDFQLNFELALVYLRNIRDYQEAATYLRKCIMLNPNSIEALEKLTNTYLRDNDQATAFDVRGTMRDMIMDMNYEGEVKPSTLYYIAATTDHPFGHWKLGFVMYYWGHSKTALERIKHALELRPNLLNVMMSLTTSIQEIKDKMQWCSSWWCPKHGSLEQCMPYLKPETSEETKALVLAIKRQKHWVTKTRVRCIVYDRKSGKDGHSVPPECYSKFLSCLVLTSNAKYEIGHSEESASKNISFLNHLEKVFQGNN